MTRFYMWGPAQGTGTTIPDTAPNAPLEDAVWTIGRQLTTDHSAIRNMYQPSLDGYSYDQWFDGMWLDFRGHLGTSASQRRARPLA